jgi:Icc protein
MRFIHLTDTHIGPLPSFANYGHNSLQNLERIVDRINALPFTPDFVLHTGDVVEDWSEAAYKLAKPVLERIKFPVYYVAGNHDDPDKLQRILLNQEPKSDRFDYSFTCEDFTIAVFDTRRPEQNPGGTLRPAQMETLRQLCTPDGPPLVIALHHQPVLLDVTWIDGWMNLDNYAEFQQILAPARERVHGVFFGHVHRAFEVLVNGILYCSGPSSFAQLASYPNLQQPDPSPEELAGFSIVTVTPTQTTVRQHYIGRP